MIDRKQLEQGLNITLFETDLPQLGELYRGKVRDNYSQAGRRTIIVSDRLSAFDVIVGTIPFKGQVLNGMAHYWFERSQEIAPNHLIAVPDPAVSVVETCRVLKVEMIVRAYLAGSSPTSIWTAYERGERVYCGHRLPEGLQKNERLPEPLITPTTKGERGEHDELLAIDEVVSSGLVTDAQWQTMCMLSLKMFALGTQLAHQRGLILVDTKYEFGLRGDGEIIFIDEIHTPDSSRYWLEEAYADAFARGETPKALDKEYVRRWLAEQGFTGNGTPPALPDDVRIEAAQRYIEIYERITGRPFVPNLEEPIGRLRRNLAIA